MNLSLIFLIAFTSLNNESANLKHENKIVKKEFKVTISKEELKLYNLINAYRKGKNLPAIPLSKSLTYVAQTHSQDLGTKNPSHGVCNIHSWSVSDQWTSCCYTDDHAEAICMWNKPRELTNYEGNGYEISSGGTNTAIEALAAWKSSTGHNAVILNEGIWKSSNWKAIGIGIKNGYATVWFGKDKDPDGEPMK